MIKTLEYVKEKFGCFWRVNYEWPEDLISENLDNYKTNIYESRLVGMGIGINKFLLSSKKYTLLEKVVLSCLAQNSIVDDDGLMITLESSKTLSAFLNIPNCDIRECIANLCELGLLKTIDGGVIIFKSSEV